MPAAAGGDAAAAGAAAGAGGCAEDQGWEYLARRISRSVSLRPKSKYGGEEVTESVGRADACGAAAAGVAIENVAGDVAASTAHTVGTASNGAGGGARGAA